MTSEERISDIKEGIDSYTAMAAFISQGDQAVIVMMAGWLATLVPSLVEWGALSQQEHEMLMGMLSFEIDQRNADIDNSLELWLQQRGI